MNDEEFDGRYRDLHVIRANGLLWFLRGYDLLFQRFVTVCMQRVGEPDLQREPLLGNHVSSRLQSEHVVRVLENRRTQRGGKYCVIEDLRGCDLQTWIRERGPLPCEQAVHFVLQACEAIAETHALGIVHRDLKPEQLFAMDCPSGPCIKIIDFSLAVPLKAASIGGTPVYMAPEQWTPAGYTDVRTDIWSLGVTLFELLTATLPYSAKDLGSLITLLRSHGALSMSEVSSSIRGDLRMVIQKCLEKEPRHRYQSVAELARASALRARGGDCACGEHLSPFGRYWA
jgi:serine/threonine protein kinase